MSGPAAGCRSRAIAELKIDCFDWEFNWGEIETVGTFAHNTHNNQLNDKLSLSLSLSKMGKGFGDGGKSGGKGKAGEPKKPVTRSARAGLQVRAAITGALGSDAFASAWMAASCTAHPPVQQLS